MDGFKDTYLFENSEDVAKYVVVWAFEHQYSINMTKLQKMLYVMYGACLVTVGERLFKEHAQAWPYGPVFPRSRRKLTKQMIGEKFIGITKPNFGDKEALLNELTTFAFNGFGKYTASQLVAWTHLAGSPWSIAKDTEDFVWGHEIPDASIFEYFDRLIIRHDDERK